MKLREIQELFDQSRDVIAVLDGDLHYEAANKEYCRYWGVPRDKVIGASVESVVGTAAFDDEIRDYLGQCLGGEHVSFERWLDFPGVGRRYMHVTYSPRIDDAGAVAGVFIIAHDTTSQQQLQVELCREHDRMTSILSSVNVGLALFDPDLTVRWGNRRLKSMFPGVEIVGAKWHEIFKGMDKQWEECASLSISQAGKACSTQVYHKQNGRWYAFSSAPIMDGEGNVSQSLGHVQDITEQRESIEALTARESELQSVFRATRVGIGVVRDRRFIQANDHFFAMLGYSRDELIGRNSRIVYASDEEYEIAGSKVYGEIHGDTTAAVEAKWMRKDGSLLDVLITITPLRPDDPSAGSTFVAMDITDSRRAEEAVRESEYRFRELFESVDMIAVQGYDEARRVTYWNPASEQLYGYSREETMGRLLEDLIIPEPMKDAVIKGHETWLSGGAPIPPGELELRSSSGEPVPVYSSHVMQETAAGDKYMYCIDVDLSEIKRIHNQLVLAKDEAEAANLAKSEFLANMSHEIRTPLNGVQGMLALMQSTELDETQREYVQAGLESAVRLNRLLSDILDLSRVEAGKLSVCQERFDLSVVIRQVSEFFRLSSEEGGVSLECAVAPDVPTVVVGDGSRLQQILTNLVGNGLKYTDSGTVQLDVSRLSPVRPGTHRILFTVTDTGIGIGTDVLKNLFEPFVQGSSGFARQYQGAGLGLSICKRLVSLMGGNMSVASESGVGTTVNAVLQFGEEIADVEDTPSVDEGAVSTAVKLRVLLVEDDRINSIVGKRLLEKQGCAVEVATNGLEALEVLKAQSFDFILMDIQMPGKDGLETTAAIRNGEAGTEDSDVPIYALTAYTMTGDREKFLSVGMNGYIPKPVEVGDLRTTISQVLEMRREAKGRAESTFSVPDSQAVQ